MNILHITETVSGASGVATFVRELDAALRTKGVASRVACPGREAQECAIGADACDIVHIHGLWLPFYHQASEEARRRGIPVVWSTHGMSAPWSMRHKRWKKLAAWWMYQRRDLRRAAAIHCTTGLEVAWNSRLGFANCFVAPLGTAEASRADAPRRGEPGVRVLLFVGRIHPVKGLENLIRAWAEATGADAKSGSAAPWRLRIVGPDEGGYMSVLKALVERLSVSDTVEFAGPRFGADLSSEYDGCDCLVLPSFTENFGATVIDAMAHGRPCIASTATPWKALRERGCGWWVDNAPATLAAAIRDMMSAGDAARAEMGERGRAMVAAEYTWSAVADRMIGLYGRCMK